MLSGTPLGTDFYEGSTTMSPVSEVTVNDSLGAAQSDNIQASAAAIGQNNHAIDITLTDGSRIILGGLSAANKATLEAGTFANVSAFYTAIADIETYDAEKLPGDYWGCGLGTAANMLAQTGWGNVNGFASEDAIFDYFRDAFNYETGAQGGFATDSVLEWFLNGTPLMRAAFEKCSAWNLNNAARVVII